MFVRMQFQGEFYSIYLSMTWMQEVKAGEFADNPKLGDGEVVLTLLKDRRLCRGV